MLKLVKYSFIYLAAFIMLLHNIVPHTHESQITNEQHAQVHQEERTSPIDLLALIFHEFTEEGEMEDILVRANTHTSITPVFIPLLALVNLNDIVLTTPEEIIPHPLLFDELQQSAGFSNAWSVRPPPCA